MILIFVLNQRWGSSVDLIKSSFLDVLNQAKASKNNCYQVYGKDKGYCIVNITKELNLFLMGRCNKKASDDPLVDALKSDYAYFAWADADTESEIFDAIDVIKFDDEKTRRTIKYKNTTIKYNNDLYAASVARHPENLNQYDVPRLLYEFMTSSSDSDLSDSIEPLLSVTKPDASESETSDSSGYESGEETDAKSSVSDRSGRGNRKRTFRKHRQQNSPGGDSGGGGGGGAK